MKRFCCLLLLSVFVLTSCVVQENLNFNEDGSGRLLYKIDMSKMMTMAGDKFGEKSSKRKSKKNNKMEDNSKDIDSVFSYKDMLAGKEDSIAKLPIEEQARLKKMEKYSGRLVMNEAQKKMEFHLFTDFMNPAELQDLVSPVNSLAGMNSSTAQLGNDAPKNEGVTSYDYNGKKFVKIVTVAPKSDLKKDLEKLDRDSKKEGEEDINVEKLASELSESFKMMYNESSYEMTVSFPKKIKKVSIPNAKISDDGKTVVLVFPMENYMESKDVNFEVELE
ncbi:hypothetical protein [Flavobacterium lacisediminis]|uniref:Lipoprotein n=1 Tax=Flavobacterium lacisediminis TaxID=2989705 RepID=A0ABT3EFM6_9FLAO|nr:hypothetical protein [Flavobacterium lacisediminis]MCW1147387.1 hypothetical protein [Flavobacterium lacisediminis]